MRQEVQTQATEVDRTSHDASSLSVNIFRTKVVSVRILRSIINMYVRKMQLLVFTCP